jgi:hypothetical protein
MNAGFLLPHLQKMALTGADEGLSAVVFTDGTTEEKILLKDMI